MRPVFFRTASEFRAWLDTHHETDRELWVGFYKKSSGRPSLTWPEAVDEALCYGWIDGIRKSYDSESYVNRFTPRSSRSNWSEVNLRKFKALIRAKRIQPAGLRAYRARDPKRARYSFEQRNAPAFDPAALKKFKANRAAWRFFDAQPPGYRRVATFWVISAKRPETRARRLDTLIADSAAGRRIGLLTRDK